MGRKLSLWLSPPAPGSETNHVRPGPVLEDASQQVSGIRTPAHGLKLSSNVMLSLPRPLQTGCRPPPCSDGLSPLPFAERMHCTDMSLYLPESPVCRSSEAEARPRHVPLSPYPRTWRGVRVRLCSVEKDLCQGNCKLVSGCVSLPRSKGKSGSVCKRQAQKVTGEQGKAAGEGVCVGVGGHGRTVFVNPQPTQGDNGSCH